MKETKYWYEEFPALYKAELEALKFGFPEFKFLRSLPPEEKDGLIVVEGEVKYSETGSQLVSIEFPHAYPNTPIRVIPINQQVIFVNGKPMEAVAIINYNKGAQYSDGRMCLFKDEDIWDPGRSGIGDIIPQVVKWLQAATTDKGFTPDITVDERLPLIASGGTVLYGIKKKVPFGSTGTILLKAFKEGTYALLQLQIETPKGPVVIPSIPDDKVLTSPNKEYIRGSYFQFEQFEPKSIVPAIANNDGFKGFVNNILGLPLDSLLSIPTIEPKRTVIAFSFGKKNEIHYFQLTYWKEGMQTKYNVTYLLAKDLDTELFVRVKDLLEPDKLQKKSVLIVGLGAIGSEVAKELGAAGVGNFVLYDEESFDVGNTVRHAGDLLKVNEPKVEIAKNHIEARNPFAKITALPKNIFTISPKALEKEIEAVDVVLDLTAIDAVGTYLYDFVCKKHKKPLIQASVSMGGLTGVVLTFLPGKSACLKCLRDSNFDSPPISTMDISSLKETAPDFGHCSKPAIPASGIDTREVSLQVARIVLQLLSENGNFYPPMQGLQYYWNGPAGSINTDFEINAPHSWCVKTIPPNKECNYCQTQ